MATYYHVTGETWEPGDDLMCWNRLYEQGIVTTEDWKWEDAEVGFDGDVICLFECRSEAGEFMAEFGGARVLVVEIPDDHEGWGVGMTTVSEGFAAVYGRIPAEWIKVA